MKRQNNKGTPSWSRRGRPRLKQVGDEEVVTDLKYSTSMVIVWLEELGMLR